MRLQTWSHILQIHAWHGVVLEVQPIGPRTVLVLMCERDAYSVDLGQKVTSVMEHKATSGVMDWSSQRFSVAGHIVKVRAKTNGQAANDLIHASLAAESKPFASFAGLRAIIITISSGMGYAIVQSHLIPDLHMIHIYVNPNPHSVAEPFCSGLTTQLVAHDWQHLTRPALSSLLSSNSIPDWPPQRQSCRGF